MIVAGFGFREIATCASLLDAFARASNLSWVAGVKPTHLAVPADKDGTASMCAAARHLDLPLIAIDAEQLAGIETITQSAQVLEWRGVGSVAEAVALAACGRHAQLLGARAISSDRLATCAIARRISGQPLPGGSA